MHPLLQKDGATNRIVSGSLAGLVARLIGAPFDVVKIRMQAQLCAHCPK